MYIALKCKVPFIIVQFLRKLQFSGQIFLKNIQISNNMNRPVGAELFHSDRRTDMTKLIVAFRDFANAPKNTNFNTRINEA